jgi:phosphoribosylamine--glycine ligase
MLSSSGEHAMCVVLAAEGYPEAPTKGDVIVGLDAAGDVPGVLVFHAGTQKRGGEFVTSGGRVLGVTARGRTLAEARERVYQAVNLIDFRGKQYRRDIGYRALSS